MLHPYSSDRSTAADIRQKTHGGTMLIKKRLKLQLSKEEEDKKKKLNIVNRDRDEERAEGIPSALPHTAEPI